jgi:hypothetical protein
MPGGGVFGLGARREVRNPVLALPATGLSSTRPPEMRRLLGDLLAPRQGDDGRVLAGHGRPSHYPCDRPAHAAPIVTGPLILEHGNQRRSGRRRAPTPAAGLTKPNYQGVQNGYD